MRIRLTPALALALALAALVATAPDADAVRYEGVKIGRFEDPSYVTAPRKSKRLFVVERAGRIRVFNRGKLVEQPFLDIRPQVLSSYQRGLLSIAFAPGYSRNGRFYAMYVTLDDQVQVDEFRRSRNSNRARISSQRPVLTVGRGSFFHHGGQLQFGPDGKLYISTGVADHDWWAQDMQRLNGKMLRIDPRASDGRPYTVPMDNPFVGVEGTRPEIWASGLRNPWRFSFHPKTGAMAIGEVGNVHQEEIDYIPRGKYPGANFGFPLFEGRQRLNEGPVPPRYRPPVAVHKHKGPNAFCAIMGGYWVRDRKLPTLRGRYIYADMCSTTYRTITFRRGRKPLNRRANMRIPAPISFGEDARGRLYVVSLYEDVYRVRVARDD